MTPQELSDVERRAMERAWHTRIGTASSPHLRRSFEQGFLAGLRYPSEITEAQVEAAARVLKEWMPNVFVNDWEQTEAVPIARDALNAAREVRGDAADS